MREIGDAVANPEASVGYGKTVAKIGVGAIAVGSALGLGWFAADKSKNVAEEATEEAGGFAAGGR